ncbi:hypothetical protein LX36DRAFT_183903 [Colletotrichum falcatum]|nr:hypothetical protein LX36DRAFT_183903 [Colletotrichum falcatum]
MEEAGRSTTFKAKYVGELENEEGGRKSRTHSPAGYLSKQMDGLSNADPGKKKNQIMPPHFSICGLAAALHRTRNSSHAPQLPAGSRRSQEGGRGPEQTPFFLFRCSTPIPAPLLTKESHAITGQKGGRTWRSEPLGCLGMGTGHLEGLASRGLAMLV